MNKVWKIVGIAALVAILGVAAVGAVAYAQEAEESADVPFDFAQRFRDAIAGILGITAEEFDAAVDQAQGQVVDEAVTEGWLTEEQGELFRWRMEQAPGFGGFGMGGPMGKGSLGHGRGMLGGGGDSLLSAAAEALDMSLTDLLTELQGGTSIAALAEEKGVDPQMIVDAHLAELRENLDEAVAEGRMTQRQADYALEQAETRALERIEATGLGRGGCHGFGRWGGPGGPGGESTTPGASDA